MTFELNLDGVDAWGSSIILRSGTHPVKVVDEEIDTSGDHPVVKLQMEAIGGDEAGGEIRDWIHITEKTKGRIVQLYNAFGVEIPKGAFKWISLKGKRAKILVREEPKRNEPDKTVSQVKTYMPLGADDVADAVADAFAGSTASKTDDDIPF